MILVVYALEIKTRILSSVGNGCLPQSRIQSSRCLGIATVLPKQCILSYTHEFTK